MNDKIYFPGKGEGTIRYIGKLDGKEAEYVGIELQAPLGKNDGCINGIRYFSCGRRHGLFTTVDKLENIMKDGCEPVQASAIMNKYKDMSLRNLSDVGKTHINQAIPKDEVGSAVKFKVEGSDVKVGHRAQNGLNKTEDGAVSSNRMNAFDAESASKQRFGSSNGQGLFKSDNYNVKNLSVILEKAIDENSGNIKQNELAKLDYEKLKLIYQTQKLYSQSQISDLKLQVKKLKKRCLQNDNPRLVEEINRLHKENLTLKGSRMKNVRSREQIDEFILGITKDCLKMKRSVDEALELLNRCTQKKNSLSNEHCSMFYLTKNLLFAILNDDEEKTDLYFGKFREILRKNGIECSLE